MTARVGRCSPPASLCEKSRSCLDDHRKGAVGTVERLYADAGDMTHVVRLIDRTTAHYYADEIDRTRARRVTDDSTKTHD